MRQRLLWKLLIGHIVPVFAVIALVVWRAIDRSAADYYRVLVERYQIAPDEAHRLFLCRHPPRPDLGHPYRAGADAAPDLPVDPLGVAPPVPDN